ncbi:hypothetical protein BpHYR1_051105 [Brachionus plicatilis]|uniref:Uncharacterized protein n=1 Tax=Brachionus plicatilis TaxID=10195 RepID=A0A3M7S2B6_BRAPC|nr:hypothetical protein BpHYR1_051105 [Brachionus plicatilis]
MQALINFKQNTRRSGQQSRVLFAYGNNFYDPRTHCSNYLKQDLTDRQCYLKKIEFIPITCTCRQTGQAY